MNLLRRLRLGTRLATGFAALLLLLVIITFIGITRMSSLKKNSSTLSDEIYPKVVATQKMLYLMMDIARATRNIIILTDNAKMAANQQAIDKDLAEYQESLKYLQGHTSAQEERQMVAEVDEASKTYFTFSAEVDALGMKNQNVAGQTLLFGPRYKSQAALQHLLQNLAARYADQTREASREAHATYVGSSIVLGVSAAIAVLLGIIAALMITRSITVPMLDAVDTARKVASGDLTKTITDHAPDETGELLAALQEMNLSLSGIVSNVRTRADTIVTASREIAAGNLDLSSRTEQQASSLEETASAMEELTYAVKQNADNALQANNLAATASKVAVEGGGVVNQVVQTMDQINEASLKIVDIISVIDGIAFQTNLLALNAAVEAARAGEQGRGFAVVASEVRTLAQRSNLAAKEIKTLIDDSVTRVGNGSRLVRQAGETMTEIVASVARVTDIVSDISGASREQSNGIEQVNLAITQMDKVTQQNAALVEQAAAASQSLQEQSRHLHEMVSVFRLNSDDDKPAATARPQGGSRIDRPNHEGALAAAIA